MLGQGEFDYSFVEDEVKKLYDEDKRATQIYVTFAGLAICISCLGLFGLSLYDIRQRYREIALRKVNGATGKQVALLLVRSIYIYWGRHLQLLFLWPIISFMIIPRTLQ